MWWSCTFREGAGPCAWSFNSQIFTLKLSAGPVSKRGQGAKITHEMPYEKSIPRSSSAGFGPLAVGCATHRPRRSRFTKNRRIVASPQHMPAKPFAIARTAVTHLMSPAILRDLRAISASLSSPWTPWLLDPSATFFTLCHLENSIIRGPNMPAHMRLPDSS